MRCVSFRSLNIVNYKTDAKENTSHRCVTVFQDAKIRKNVKQDILEIAKRLLLEMVAVTMKIVPIITMFIINLRRPMTQKKKFLSWNSWLMI